MQALKDLQAPKQGGEAQKDRDYSEAVAAIAASLTARFAELAERAAQDLPREPDAMAVAMAAALSEKAPADAGLPQRRVPQDNAPRWHIEAPDFVFGKSDDQDRNGGAEPAGETALSRSQLLGAALLAQEHHEALNSIEEPRFAAIEPVIEPAPEPEPAAIPETPVAATPVPRFSPPADIVPLVELSRPQLRIANDPAPVNQQPRRYDLLTVTDALSEDEVIALFG